LQSRSFAELTYTTTETVSPGEIRINFLNDIPDPNFIDRDVAIDRIEINGVAYETEGSEVFSTGTYNSNGDLVPGFLGSEVLQTNGYFQYGEPAPTDPNTITLLVAGSTANEIITLEISGQVVATWNLADNGGQAGNLDVGNFIPLTFTADDPIEASDVRINFTNDRYEPDNGIDYNVAVDRIEIDGIAYETEAPTTWSTGTWRPEIGVVPGFVESQILTSNGYFQFLFDPGTNNGGLQDGDVIQLVNVQFDTARLRALGNDAFTWTSNGDDTRWTYLNPDGDNQFQLRNVANGRYLDGDQFDVDTASSSSNFGTTWEFQEVAAGEFHLYNVAYDRIVNALGSIATVNYDSGTTELNDRWTIQVV